MQNRFRTINRLPQQIVAALFAFTVSQAHQAHAAYTVIDDDLLPTALTEPQQKTQARYAIPFAKERSPLTSMGRAALDTLIPQMNGASIRIVGRPDATIYTQGKIALLASNRANNIRDYLTRQGIPGGSITVDIDNTPNPQPNGSIYPSDLYISHGDNRSPLSYPAPYAQAQQPLQPLTNPSFALAPAAGPTAQPINLAAPRRPSPVAVSVPSTTSPGPSHDVIINYINQSVLSGQMDSTVALKLMRALIESESGNNTQPSMAYSAANAPRTQPKPAKPVAAITAITSLPSPSESGQLFVPTATPARKETETWVLNKKLTLHDNIDAWSRLAGWNPSVWNASTDFQVTETRPIDGGFPDVLRQIADSTGLNICAKKREKYVRVTDSSVSCKN